jgi:membrane protease subunit HflK
MAWGDKGGNDNGPWGKPSGGGGSGGGNRPPGGGGNVPPGPDFELIMRKSHDKFREFFSQGGGESGKGIALIAVIILLLWLASGVYFVKADEQGVVLRFGEYTRTTSAGLNYHLPYPIERVITPKVTVVNRTEIGFRSGAIRNSRAGDGSIPEESLMLTGDENIVNVSFEVQWKIGNAPDYLFNIRDPEDTVKAVGESAMREIVGKTPITPILAEGKSEAALATKILMQQMLDSYKSGVEIVSVNLKDADPPAQVIDAFRDVQSARADLETARNQAEAYRNDIIPRARGEAQKMILEAEGYKQEVVARAQGEASRFLAVYNEFKQAKDVTKKRIYLETMEEIMHGMNKIIVDNKGTQGVLPYLPLSELKNNKPAEEAKP